MPVIYNDYELRPVQGVVFGKTEQAFGDGRTINSVIRATVNGTIVPDKILGVESPVDADSKMSVILAKQKEIRDAFSVQGKVFEVQGWDGQPPVKFQARVVEINFAEGIWFNTAEYSITLESAEFSGESDGNLYVESASESWSLSSDSWPNKVSHTVQAKGRLVYDATGGIPKLPWEYARDFAVNQLKLGWTAVGAEFSPKSGFDLAGSAQGQPISTTAWNRTMTEEINETEGTYNATESWILMDASYYEDYSIEVHKVDDQPNLMVVVGMSGTIDGHSTIINDFDTRMANADAAWATIKDLLLGRASASAGTTLNTHPSAYSVERHPQDGTLTYKLEFNNRVLTNDTWETYNVSKKRSIEDYKSTVTVSGTIYGVSYLDTDSDPSIRFQRAQAQWEIVKGLTYARAVRVSGLSDLKTFPVHAEVSEDPAQGTVQYTYDYDNRPYVTVEVTYTVARKYSRDNAQTTVVVEGTIQGLVNDSGADIFAAGDINERYNNAAAYWGGMEGTLLGVAALYVDTDDQYPEAWSKSFTVDRFAGRISFSYEFTSLIRCFPNALSETMSIADELSVPEMAVIPIPGKADGPVVQDVGTVTLNSRTFNVELVFPLPRVCGYTQPPVVDVSPYAPQGSLVWKSSDTPTWNWTQGRYSRTVTWKYRT